TESTNERPLQSVPEVPLPGLSPGRRRLLNTAREKKSEKHYTYLWIRGGKILMRKAEGEPVKVVTSLADLDKL
ncbi:hypothetical protein J6590_094385, partial [Homalodisca vitripennis]